MNKKIEFFHSVSVIDTETTNLYPDQAEIVEIASGIYDNNSWKVSSRFFGAASGIPPEASAKNHISNRMIKGLPTFNHSYESAKKLLNWDKSYIVAHNSKYDQEVLKCSWLRADKLADSYEASQINKWLCTYRLSKHLLSNDNFLDMQYNLSYLRYKLDLPVSDDIPAHRADADVLVTCSLLEFLVEYAIAISAIDENEPIGPQLHNLCWKQFDIKVWPYGKHKGSLISSIDTSYLLWAVEKMDVFNECEPSYNSDLHASVLAELESRINN